jgi:hypothetical protein
VAAATEGAGTTPDPGFLRPTAELSTSKGNFSFSLYNSASGRGRRRRIARPSAPRRQPFDCRVFADPEQQQTSMGSASPAVARFPKGRLRAIHVVSGGIVAIAGDEVMCK